uniref:Predicted protein n=1 Tax=Hordeum vulgare subsp. vulgare TaxID=112509 RepID=F2EKH8_HORVV|nr:predicted protein [Hordeum vulgare subsp. vulgare]
MSVDPLPAPALGLAVDPQCPRLRRAPPRPRGRGRGRHLRRPSRRRRGGLPGRHSRTSAHRRVTVTVRHQLISLLQGLACRCRPAKHLTASARTMKDVIF